MSKILIHLLPSNFINALYEDSFKSLNKEYGIQIHIFYPDKKIEKSKISNNKNILFNYHEYKSEEEIFDFISQMPTSDKFEVYTYREVLIPLMFELKHFLGQEVTKNKNLLISKLLQREHLSRYNPNITVNYIRVRDINSIDIESIDKDFGFPLILKPSTGISSSGVMKINSKKELKDAKTKISRVLKDINKEKTSKNFEIIIEEYLYGKMYTIDYFVDSKGNLHSTDLVRTFTLKEEYGINDFGITKEVLGPSVSQEIDKIKLESFISQSIKACKIKNTFIHHEFKVTDTGDLKTIELNGRIGGYRLEFYNEYLGIQLLPLLFNIQSKPKEKLNYIFIGLFPSKEENRLFNGLKSSFIKDIETLPSFHKIYIKEKLIGKKIGFTKNGHKFFGTVRLKSIDKKQIEDDYTFIKENLNLNIMYLN